MSIESEKYLSQLHAEILNIMDEIKRVCDENQIKYYLIGGTLLGALRHKGFIPWDDDFDIVMPRKDFEKFVKIAPKALNQQYYLEWITTNSEYWLPFAKVCRANTVFEEDKYPGAHHNFGIFVDIFVLDTTNGLNHSVQLRKTVVTKCWALMQHKVDGVKVALIKSIIIKCFTMRFIHKVVEIVSKGLKQDGVYFSNFTSRRSIDKQTILKKDYLNGVEVGFEDRKYNAPINSNAVLTSIFGKKYMEVPPKDKQETHYPVRVRFSDGKELKFEYTEDQVVIKENI